jgi:hypothetical protein
MKTPTVEMLVVTPAIADTYLRHSVYERQRNRAEWHVSRLAHEISEGRFIAGTQIHFGVIKGREYLVNGQHTLAGIVRSGNALTLSILRTPCDGFDELGQLYGRHDRHRGRTPHDGFLGMGLANELNMSEAEINSFGSGLKYVLMDFRRVSVTVNSEIAMSLDFLADRMREWAPAAGLYYDHTRDARHGMKGTFRRAPVVGVGIATFKYQPVKAAEFWGGAAADDGLYRTDPRRALNSFLASQTTMHGDPLNYMRTVGSAWNKFFEGGEAQFLRPIDVGKSGLTLRGTPYKAVSRKGRPAVAVEKAEAAL